MEKDPGLDDLGHAQAKAAALILAPLGPLPIITSPLTRTRETSRPLAEIWEIEPRLRNGWEKYASLPGINQAGSNGCKASWATNGRISIPTLKPGAGKSSRHSVPARRTVWCSAISLRLMRRWAMPPETTAWSLSGPITALSPLWKPEEIPWCSWSEAWRRIPKFADCNTVTAELVDWVAG